MHLDEIEEMEYQLNARADYLSEAFGAEACMLDAQARDEEAADAEMYAKDCGFATAEGHSASSRATREKARASEAIAQAHSPVDDCPF